MDEKLTARFDTRIDTVEQKIDSLRAWAIGLVFALLTGFAGIIVALLLV